jgi:hypothetical protein
MAIAVCRVAPAHAIPDQDKDGKSGAGDQNWHGPTPEKSNLRAVPNLLENFTRRVFLCTECQAFAPTHACIPAKMKDRKVERGRGQQESSQIN